MFTKRSACYMNLMECHDDSLKESLKQTMLNQENMFRKQVNEDNFKVQELHRLYQIQIILMKNLRLKEVPKTQSMNCYRQDCRVNWPRYEQRPLDLEVPASSYVNNFDKHFLNNGNGWGTHKMPVEVKDYFHGETVFSLEEAKLSLSIGRDTSQRMIWGNRNEKGSFVAPQDIIDLEESIGTMLSGDVELKSALCVAASSVHSGEGNSCHFSCSCTNSMSKDLSNRINNFQSLRDERINVLEQNSLNQGDKKWLQNFPEMELSVVGNVFPSQGATFLDLNIPQPDESSLDLKDLKMDYSSAAASSGLVTEEFYKGTSPDAVCWRKPNDNCSGQVSALLQHDTPDSVLMVCKRTDSTNVSGSKPCSIDLESFPMSSSNCSEDDDCLCKEAELVNDGTVTKVNEEKSDGVLVHSHLCSGGETVEDPVDDRSPAFSKSDHAAQDPSSSLKTMQSGTNLGKSLSRMNSFQNSDSSQVDSSGVGESKSRSSDEENGGPVYDDPVIHKGAVSLIYFLLEARREQDCLAEVKKTNEVEKEKIDQPECSMDSFESIVLKLPESKAEDYCVSSNPYEINDMDMKDCGIKLRRGRRLKDFQKDILPSLPSLSRQEICEDIRIMEGAIRSREYKRLRSKMISEQNWFTPVRSRRSRLNYIGRRYYK